MTPAESITRRMASIVSAEGFRPGNFKPSAETIDAIRSVMLAAGVTPPPPTPRPDAPAAGAGR